MTKINMLLALIEAGIIDSDLKNCTDHVNALVPCQITPDALILAWAKDPDFIKKYPEVLGILITNPTVSTKKKQASQPINTLELR